MFTNIKTLIFLVGTIFVIFTTWDSIYALELEERLPSSVLRMEASIRITPEYDEAYGGTGERIETFIPGLYGGTSQKIPLKDLLIRSRTHRSHIEGTVQRQETIYQLKLDYGFSEKWRFGATLPFIQRKQTSTLRLASDLSGDSSQYATEQRIIKNLSSEEINGVGDISITTGYETHYSGTSLVLLGAVVKLPTGNTGDPKGAYAYAIGDQQVDVSGYVHINSYPRIHGLRAGTRIVMTNQLKGDRKNLEGEEGDYYGGNLLDLYHHWTYEPNNWLIGAELQYSRGEESTIEGKGLKNTSYIYQLHLQTGYGNLSDLEKSPVTLPYQFNVEWFTPLSGQNVPAYSGLKLLLLMYF